MREYGRLLSDLGDLLVIPHYQGCMDQFYRHLRTRLGHRHALPDETYNEPKEE